MVREAGVNPLLLEITNIREQCSWVHEDPVEATRKAVGLVKGAVSRMENLESLEPTLKDLKDGVLVVGGGIAGITAALELADEREVVLIEKKEYIGGQMIGLSKTFPTFDCSQCILTPRMVDVFNHPNITLYTQTEVVSVDGNVGDFNVTLRRMPRFVDVELCNACGRCARECPEDAISLPFAQAIPQAYIIDKDICSECGLCEEACAVGAIKLDEEPEDIIGSRNLNHGNKHCSRVCCLYSQKQAQLLLKMNPAASVTIFYIDMRSAGRRMEELYYHTQEVGVKFVRGQVAEINPQKDGKLEIRYEDTLLGDIGQDEFDMVVLCPSLEPSKGSRGIASQLNIPIGSDGFIEEKHVKIDPVNTLNQGVFAAGCAIGPKDIHDSVTEAMGAAHKISRFIGKGTISISPEKPIITDKCKSCGTCIEECPYDALTDRRNPNSGHRRDRIHRPTSIRRSRPRRRKQNPILTTDQIRPSPINPHTRHRHSEPRLRERSKRSYADRRHNRRETHLTIKKPLQPTQKRDKKTQKTNQILTHRNSTTRKTDKPLERLRQTSNNTKNKRHKRENKDVKEEHTFHTYF
ncbi:hypothetical protein B6V01_003155 [Methanosarcinales archaeon ex4572_44]|nr:MAG: hypothetical protein B6V01_003155 [Methanosarcinales archaeon ex4572_44]